MALPPNAGSRWEPVKKSPVSRPRGGIIGYIVTGSNRGSMCLTYWRVRCPSSRCGPCANVVVSGGSLCQEGIDFVATFARGTFTERAVSIVIIEITVVGRGTDYGPARPMRCLEVELGCMLTTAISANAPADAEKEDQEKED
jgi:hypothetical protein